MREIDRYLDQVLLLAEMDRASAERLRAEAKEHLESLVSEHLSKGESLEVAEREACADFGEPSWLGGALRQAQGGWRTWKSRWCRPLPIALMFLFLGWTVNTYAFEVYSIQGTCLAPRLDRGDHVLIEKWGPLKAEDIVVYRDGERSLVGLVATAPSEGRLSVRRNDVGLVALNESQVVGRVVLRLP
jgi:hypothetical protein